MTRYPIEPLLRLSGLTMSQLSQRFGGFGGAEYRRYRKEGVTVRVADRLAVACGFHPAEVWPEWVVDVDAERARKKAEYQRRYRRKPHAAEANRARRRAYYAENGDYERARQRNYDRTVRAAARERVAS